MGTSWKSSLAPLAALVAVILGYLVWRWAAARARVAASKRAYDADVRLQAHQDRAKAARDAASPLRSMPTAVLRKGAHVAHYGVRERYTSTGELVQGVPPQPELAVRMYDELLRRGENVFGDYARLLEYGTPGMDTGIDAGGALKMYTEQYRRTPGLRERYDILECMERVSGGSPVYRSERTNLARKILGLPTQRPARATTQKPGNQQAGKKVTTPQPVRTTGEDIWQFPLDGHRAPDDPTRIRSDAHNAHDTGVTRTVKTSIEKLQGAVGTVDQTVAARQVRELILAADVPTEKRARAIQALDAIERNNHTLGTVNMTETAILGLVWGRLNHEDNLGNREALRENLVDELSESIEHGKPVCAMGRLSRVLGTLNGVDALVDIKPKWALSQEMINKAGAMFKDKVTRLPEADRAAVQALQPTEEQEQAYERVMNEAKADIRDELRRSYVSTGIMTNEAFEVETSKWIDHIG
ncbi:hypothetical protein ACK3TF_005795 [Chlorella vulgaris]